MCAIVDSYQFCDLQEYIDSYLQALLFFSILLTTNI